MSHDHDHDQECECCKNGPEVMIAKQTDHIKRFGCSVIMLPTGSYTVGYAHSNQHDYFVGYPSKELVYAMNLAIQSIPPETEFTNGVYLATAESTGMLFDVWVFDVPYHIASEEFPWGFTHPLVEGHPVRYRHIVFADQQGLFPWEPDCEFPQTPTLTTYEMATKVANFKGNPPAVARVVH